MNCNVSRQFTGPRCKQFHVGITPVNRITTQKETHIASLSMLTFVAEKSLVIVGNQGLCKIFENNILSHETFSPETFSGWIMLLKALSLFK